MGNIYKGMLGLIGNTPLMEIVNVEKELGLEATVLVKLEYLNPAGSVKDRVARAMIEDAEEQGILKEGSVIIEPTSGNTGIALAALAAFVWSAPPVVVVAILKTIIALEAIVGILRIRSMKWIKDLTRHE